MSSSPTLKICFTVNPLLCLVVVVLSRLDQVHSAAGTGTQTNTSKADFVKICRADNGHLSLSPRKNLIQSITEVGDGKTKQVTETVFVQHNREFKFQCVYTKGTKGNSEGSVPQIDFKPGTSFGTSFGD